MPTPPLRTALVATLGLFLATSALAAPSQRGRAIGDARDEELAPRSREPSDLALLRALLWALEPAPLEVRAQAVEDLGLLGDPRALNALAVLVLDPTPRIAQAALRAVALVRHPRAEEILTNVIRHPSLSESLKAQAAALLVFQNSDTAIRFMKIVTRTNGWPQNVQIAMGTLLQDVPPGRGGMP